MDRSLLSYAIKSVLITEVVVKFVALDKLYIGHDSWEQGEVGAVRRRPETTKMAAQGATAAGPVSCRESEVEREKREEECVRECFTWLRMNEKLLG